MTFFFATFDPETRILSYCNASHDPPYVFPYNNGDPIRKSHIEPLMDKTGKRLGEDPAAEYETVDVHLQDGDRIAFYTDGVTELNNNEGDMWGERKFLKTLLSSFNNVPSQFCIFVFHLIRYTSVPVICNDSFYQSFTLISSTLRYIIFC